MNDLLCNTVSSCLSRQVNMQMMSLIIKVAKCVSFMFTRNNIGCFEVCLRVRPKYCLTENQHDSTLQESGMKQIVVQDIGRPKLQDNARLLPAEDSCTIHTGR